MFPIILNTSSNHYHHPVRETGFWISSDVYGGGGGDVRDDDFQSHFLQRIRGEDPAVVRHIGYPASTAHISSLPCASCASILARLPLWPRQLIQERCLKLHLLLYG